MNKQKLNQKRWPTLMALLGLIGGMELVSENGLVTVASAQGNPLVYVPAASPCRVLRTQGTGQTHLIAGAPRDFFSFGSAGTISAQGGNAAGCDHPRSAVGILPAAIAANVTAVGNQATGNGNIVAFPAGGAVPGASTVNYTPTANIANSTLINLRTSDGKFTLMSSFANVPAIVDVVGYFYPTNAYGATGVISIPAMAFRSLGPAGNWFRDSAPGDVALTWLNLDGLGTVSCHDAPLYIPDGAVITKMTVFFKDDSSGFDFTGPLLTRTSVFGVDDPTAMGTIDLSGTDSPLKFFAETTFIQNSTIDLFNFYYEVRFCFNSTLHRLYSVVIEFSAS